MLVSITVVRGILAEFQRSGNASPQPLWARHGLTKELLVDMQTVLPAEAIARIVTHAIELDGHPSLGWRAGSCAPELAFQMVAQLAFASPNLRAGLRSVARYGRLLIRHAFIHFREDGGTGQIRFTLERRTNAVTERFLAEYLSAVIVQVARRYLEPNEHPTSMGYQHTAAPEVAATYGTALQCPLSFGQLANWVAFDRSLLERASPCADHSVAKALTRAADLMLQRLPLGQTVGEQVRSILRGTTDLCSANAERLASELGLSHRVLRRRLAEEGQQLSRLVEYARVERARLLLRQPGSSVKDAAEQLGYSDASAFHRAFRRWTGRTPGQFMLEYRAPRTAGAEEDASADEAEHGTLL